ncbi:MAG: hypothetical protein JWR61_5604 [Ferruginibacter sp.]|nr:hypothetical protein [Ferruginibacter sp.]
MITNKTCSRCNTVFQCGATEANGHCWCNNYPPLFKPDPLINCMCKDCLHNATLEKVNNYVAEMTTEKALNNNIAKDLPKTNYFIEGIDFYLEKTFSVFTAWYHLKRGYCCNNGCRHCPYGFKKDTL